MVFSSISFIYYFLPFVIILYFLAPKNFRNFVLFISSIIFYTYGEPKFVLIMLLDILIAYIGGRLMEKYNKKTIMTISVTLVFTILFIFKYFDFAIFNINKALNTNINLLRIALPIGISFYTFQIVSYIVDVYRGTVKPQKSFLKLATYVSMFPQLIAGPIVRYETIEKQLDSREYNFEKFAIGVRRFIIGLAKKVLIANSLGEFCTVFYGANEKTIILTWAYGIAYSLQVYFDFSAYSDMAIGLGKILGFDFLENFDYPYISKSITEFWRRWHISLGTWFKDYSYIPLGGSRVGKIKLIRNLFVVWFFTGLWHGANWNFIIWGLLFFVFLVLEKIVFKKILEKAPSIICRMYVLFIVMISFIIFNANSMSEAFRNIIGLFGGNGENIINDYTIYYLKNYFVILLIAIIGATPLLKFVIEKIKIKFPRIVNLMEPIILVALLLIITAYLVDNSYNPFLYFRF